MSDRFGEKPTVENKPTVEQKAEQSVAIGDQSPNSPMLKLDIDCFEELFEWLPLKDLRALRRTCKRLKNVTDYYIRQNYGPKKRGFRRLKAYSDDIKKIAEMNPDHKKFINKIWTLSDEKLIKRKIDDLKPILNQVTKIEMRFWEDETDYHGIFLKHCSNLKCLCIFGIKGNNLMGNGCKWLQRKYPTLERLILLNTHIYYEDERNEIRELRTFFELNSNVRTFSTTLQFLWGNRLWLRGANIKLDQLEIQGDGFLKLDPYFDFVNELHCQGFYKRLHFYGKDIYVDGYLLRAAQLRGLEKLYLAYVNLSIALPPLEGVKELNFVFSEDIKHPNTLASNIPHVEMSVSYHLFVGRR